MNLFRIVPSNIRAKNESAREETRLEKHSRETTPVVAPENKEENAESTAKRVERSGAEVQLHKKTTQAEEMDAPSRWRLQQKAASESLDVFVFPAALQQHRQRLCKQSSSIAIDHLRLGRYWFRRECTGEVEFRYLFTVADRPSYVQCRKVGLADLIPQQGFFAS